MTPRACARLCVALIAAALIAAPAIAETRIPTRIGNTWDWRHHEPVPAQVHRAERGAGVALPPRQRQASTAEVEGLYRHLIRRSPF